MSEDTVMDTNDIDAAIAAAEHQGGYSGDYMAHRLREIKSIGRQRKRDGIPMAVFPPGYTAAEAEVAKRIIAGIQRMHDRAWFVIEYADGTRDLVPTIPDDDLEDACARNSGCRRATRARAMTRCDSSSTTRECPP